MTVLLDPTCLMPAEPAIPLVEELAPALDPWEVCLRLSSLPHLVFLDSGGRHGAQGRYSFLAADPFAWIRSRGRQVWLNDAAADATDPLHFTAKCLERLRIETMPGLPPFQGGAAGMFGYDLCHHLERLPRPRLDEFHMPDLALGFYDVVFAWDHLQSRAWIISTGLPELDRSKQKERAGQRLQAFLRQLQQPCSSRLLTTPLNGSTATLASAHALPHLPGVCSSFDRESYLATVRRAIEYVHAGDCFQVNIAQRLVHPATLPPLELYRRLRERNPAPFAGYFDLGDFVLASASPERFLRVENGEVETRPIKGTRPRGRTPAEDAALIAELQASSKDRAENVMIVDLLRNDLGRVCQYGSVHVPAVCQVESYQFVHHLVSEVRGHLRPRLGPIDLLRAAFPGGSVTGAPKIRAMEIIAELEPAARGPYCGSLGYLGFDGAMDASILIRTFMIGRGWVQFPVGGGIVADSVPEREYEETWHKAEGMLRALRG